MALTQPDAAAAVAAGKIGDKITVQGREFILCDGDVGYIVDPVFLDDPAMPGPRGLADTAEDYSVSWCHVRDDVDGAALMSRARLIEILVSGDYQVW